MFFDLSLLIFLVCDATKLYADVSCAAGEEEGTHGKADGEAVARCHHDFTARPASLIVALLLS